MLFSNASLAQTTERHPVVFDIPPVQPVADILEELRRSQAGGVVCELTNGLPSARHLHLMAEVLGSDRRAWIYWPAEQAVECVDTERLQSLRRHVTAVTWLKRLGGPVDRAAASMQLLPAGLRWIYRGAFSVRRSDILSKLDLLVMNARPVPLEPARQRRRPVACLRRLSAHRFLDPHRDDRRTVLVANEDIGPDLASSTWCRALWATRPGRRPAGRHGRAAADRGQDAIVLAPVHCRPLVKAACQAGARLPTAARGRRNSRRRSQPAARHSLHRRAPGLRRDAARSTRQSGITYAELYARLKAPLRRPRSSLGAPQKDALSGTKPS